MVVGVGEDKENTGKFIARKGSSTILLSFLNKDGIDSYSLVVWGQSANPDSPHHTDQAEKLYSQRKFKPTWFKKDRILDVQHVGERQQVRLLKVLMRGANFDQCSFEVVEQELSPA